MSYYYEKSTGKVAKHLARFPYYATDKILNLLQFQDNNQQFLISDKHLHDYFEKQKHQLCTDEKLSILFSLFKGRVDVYAKSYIDENGKINYFPSYNYGWKKLPVEKRTCQPLTKQVLLTHLRGEMSIGIFPMSLSDTCSFLAIDFDKKNWREEVSILRDTAEKYGFEGHIEISRSGNGAHLWFFFEEEIACQQARNVGKRLLELAMQESKDIRFSSFDRMFPNQDILPKGGFGNLIALPLQGEAFKKGRTVFVDKHFQPFSEQWTYLQQVQKVGQKKILDFLGQEFSDFVDNTVLDCSLSNVIRVEKRAISSKTNYLLRKLASFSNPEFYLKQATRQPTYQTPERIYLFEETDEALHLPRGILASLQEIFETVTVTDNRNILSMIQITFKGMLRFEQELALADLLASENGLLCAETGFGKTVLGAALIAQRKCRTIILVHNRQLMEQWLERLDEFLEIEEEEAVRYTPSGRIKVIGHIGQYGASKKWRSKLVDVVMIQSLLQLDAISDFLSDYDMMIVDECHHVTALQFEKVVAQFAGQYLYGLTATPERKNGHQPIVFQRIGPILHTAQSEQFEFNKRMLLRLTSFGKLDLEQSRSTNFSVLNDCLAKDLNRNTLIVQDIFKLYQEKRNILVLVNRLEHIKLLEKLLIEKEMTNIFCLSGASKRRDTKELLKRISELDENSPFVLISTGKYIGEGFDMPKLDTLILAAPLSWKNNLIQYAGRLHRPYQGKTEVRIVDYLDIHVPYLEKMYQKRQIAYRKMAYQVGEKKQTQVFYSGRNYEEKFREDLRNTRSTVHLQLHSFTSSRIQELLGLLLGKQVVIQVSKSHKLSEWLTGVNSDNVKVKLVPERIGTTTVILDSNLVWYGNLSPFTYHSDDQASLLRLESQSIATELLEKFENSNIK
ncbi:DEAD/DEAH box helicase family protein [Streptococcus suis]|nr:DEAD/DEAH box helicase family protein [Streptococcus suis]